MSFLKPLSSNRQRKISRIQNRIQKLELKYILSKEEAKELKKLKRRIWFKEWFF